MLDHTASKLHTQSKPFPGPEEELSKSEFIILYSSPLEEPQNLQWNLRRGPIFLSLSYPEPRASSCWDVYEFITRYGAILAHCSKCGWYSTFFKYAFPVTLRLFSLL